MADRRGVALLLLGVLAVSTAIARADGPPDNLVRLINMLTAAEYRTPNGWGLRPAGAQIDTPRAPTGISVSPDGNTVYVVNSGIFDEQLELIDATTFLRTLSPATDLYMGVVADSSGNIWASGGNRNRVFQFLQAGPAAIGVRHVGLVPGTPNLGIATTGFPGNMTLGPGGRLYVVGNLSVPESASSVTCPNGAPSAKPICSVVNIIDISNPLAPTPAVRLVPVGRDAYGVVLNAAKNKLYVTNWADETNPARTTGDPATATGTVSVVDLSVPGSEGEVQRVAVGRHPTGIALSPDGSTVYVANTFDDTISKLTLDTTGLAIASSPISVKTDPLQPRAGAPIALGFSPGGDLLFVALAGENAVEVLTASGAAIPRTVKVGSASVNAEHTYIPTGWYPMALATAPAPGSSSDGRLYVANLKGIGAGPVYNADASPLQGVRTEGTVSAITIPASQSAREQAFDAWTATVLENNNLVTSPVKLAADDPCQPAPLPSGIAFSQLLCDASKPAFDHSQLHVVYVVKENKTFDQYFGDIKLTLPGADADPTYLLYGEPVTTNQHNLARSFTISDNFWADSEVSTNGHKWTSAGYATERDEITWNQEYDQGLRGNRNGGQYDGNVFSGPTDGDVAAQEGKIDEPEERLVDLLANPTVNVNGLTFRVYSDDVNDGAPAKSEQVPLGMWGLGSSTVHHGRDLDFPDTDRVALFLHGHTVSNAWTFCGVPCTSAPNAPPPSFGKEIGFCDAPNDSSLVDAPDSFCGRPGASHGEYQKFSLDAWKAAYDACVAAGGTDAACQSKMPNFIYMALPVDHTLGFNPMDPTPASMVADNDYAVGQLVDALSKSPFWKTTIIMVTEDDTQLAGDHVDAHRTFLLSAGGLARQQGAAGNASHQLGSFPSILKTTEVLLGLPPVTIYDRAAAPLHDVIVNSLAAANTVSYAAVKPLVPFLRNPPDGPLAVASLKLDWTRIDRADPCELTRLMYLGLRGMKLADCPARALVGGD